MTDRPILFSAPMVRALLDGHKTQTRRVIKPNPWPDDVEPPYIAPYPEGARAVWHDPFDGSVRLAAPWAVGDRLWVRETYYQRGYWRPVKDVRTKGGRQKWSFVGVDHLIRFDTPDDFRKGRHNADPYAVAWHKRLGRFMPRSASRLTLTVTDVRVQRLQDISDDDAAAEGIYFDKMGWTAGHIGLRGINQEWSATINIAFRNLWRAVNGPDAWEANPWVVALTVDVEQRNIDGGAR